MLLTEWKLEDAIQIAQEEAREEETFNIAKKLLAMGLDLDMISKGTGLTTEQIQNL